MKQKASMVHVVSWHMETFWKLYLSYPVGLIRERIPSLKSQENEHVNQMSTNHIWLTGACYMTEGHCVFIHFTLWNRKHKFFNLKIISNLPKHYKIKIIQNKNRTKNDHTPFFYIHLLFFFFFLYSPTVDILLWFIIYSLIVLDLIFFRII